MMHQIKVKIGKKTYCLSSSERCHDVQLAAELLDEEWTQLNKRQPQLSDQQLAILLALNSKLDAIKAQRQCVAHEAQWKYMKDSTSLFSDQFISQVDEWTQQKNFSDQDRILMHYLLNELVKNKIKGHR